MAEQKSADLVTSQCGGEGMRLCPKCHAKLDDDATYCPNDGTRILESDRETQRPGPLPIGSTLGHYRLLEVLGRGGVATVYLAEHTRLGRRVALKVLDPERARDKIMLSRFFGEARAINDVSHPNIVDVTDLIYDEAEKYYVMEHLEGGTLSELLESGRSLPIHTALDIALQIASGLAAVHTANVIHRDLKPQNVLLVDQKGRDRVVKLIDFGIAKIRDPDTGESLHNTVNFAVLGTPEYMSPEQLAGAEVDHKTDIYSFGVVLYQLVTGETPFRGSNFGEYVIKHTTTPPLKPSEVQGLAHAIPPALDALILQCLAKKPSERPQSMHWVESRIHDLVGMVSAAKPAARRRARRLRWQLTLGACATVVLAASIGYLWAVSGRQVESPSFHQDEAPTVTPDGTVEIWFDSTPPGATVRSFDTGELVGVTPFLASFSRSAGSASFELVLPGHDPATTLVSMNKDTQVSVELSKTSPPREKTTAAAKHKPESDEASQQIIESDIINPFEDRH
ncbi:serine/threonine-protein kinase [Myxococcota bacterium]